ncbi:MAG: DnaJ domain-containing protein [Spirulinaceae cyanobacterium]
MSLKIEQGLFKYDLTDYHAVLGLPLTADAKQVRKRYLKVARNLHPDSCKAENEAEKKQASELLSKLVNPAYEKLSKEDSRAEYQLVLSQMGQRLATEGGKISLSSEGAKELSKAGNNLDSVYKQQLQTLAKEQYQSLGEIASKIAQISELNMVYLMKKQGKGVRTGGGTTGTTASTVGARKPPMGQGKPAGKGGNTEKKVPTSRSEPYVRRAQEYITKKNYSKAVLELRDGLKLEPNDAPCNSLLGLIYLQQKQMGMAKVYINKALKISPNDPNGVKGKKLLDKMDGGQASSKKTNSSSKNTSGDNKSGGRFGGLFGRKK